MTTFLLIDGFDVYPDVAVTSYGVQARWQATDSTYGYVGMFLVTGRFGGQGVQFGNESSESNGLGYPITAAGSGVTGLAIGQAFQLNASTTQIRMLSLRNGGVAGTDIIGVGVNASQQPFIWLGSPSTVLATATAAISTGSWHYYEFVVSIAASGGAAVLYQDGAQILSYTGNTGSLSCDSVCIGPLAAVNIATAVSSVDDVYVASGAVRIGEARVQTLYPASNGTVGWTPLSGSNYSEVNSTLNHGDTGYVYTSTASTSDLYNIGSLVNTPTSIYAVQTRVSSRKTDASSHTIESNLKSNTTTVHGATVAVAGSYTYQCDIFTTDPNTSAAWTASGVNAVQIGQTLVS